jgi:RNA polymerase sigma factor (TIGR02999 family)
VQSDPADIPQAVLPTPDDRSVSELLPLVYEQLRALARRQIAGERPGHTLTATALVHEAHLRLADGRRLPWASEAHFYVAAAEAMRQILLDHARSRNRVKRGGKRRRAPLNVLDLAAAPDPEEILALDEQLRRLGEHRPDAAAVVRLRFFAGLTVDRTAEVLGQSPRQVDRLWSYARAWMYRELEKG